MTEAEILAQYLDGMYQDLTDHGFHRYASMVRNFAPKFIRDQQAEIERLKALLEVTA